MSGEIFVGLKKDPMIFQVTHVQCILKKVRKVILIGSEMEKGHMGFQKKRLIILLKLKFHESNFHMIKKSL
jgi:hypothetical protein